MEQSLSRCRDKSEHYIFITGLGQDHHRFITKEPGQTGFDNRGETKMGACLDAGFRVKTADGGANKYGLRLAGVDIDCDCLIEANSDGDVVIHALINAISGLGCPPFLGKPADALCRAGIKDSRVYLAESLRILQEIHPRLTVVHASFSIEALKPKLWLHIPAMRSSLAKLLNLPITSIGITATTGEGLSGMGRGEGIGVTCLLTAQEICPF